MVWENYGKGMYFLEYLFSKKKMKL